MSQTDKERVIAERGATLCRKISRCASLPESAQVAAILGAVLDELRPIYDAGAKAGYIAAREDAAKAVCVHCMSKPSVAENGTFVHLDIKGRIECKAAAIRKLEPK